MIEVMEDPVQVGLAPNGRKLTRRGHRRRVELLNSAMHLFSEQGYDATTTKAIADHCGVTEAVVFRYFPTKKDLFREVVAVYGPEHHYEMPFEQYRELPFGEALIKLIQGYLDNSWTHRRSMRMFLLATFVHEDIQTMLSGYFDYRHRRLKEMIGERVAQGEIRPETGEYAAEIITLTVTGFLVRSLRREPASFPKARDKFLRELADVTVNGLLHAKG